jgi:hypothetical protein
MELCRLFEAQVLELTPFANNTSLRRVKQNLPVATLLSHISKSQSSPTVLASTKLGDMERAS